MALNKVTYTDDVTVIKAQNLNDIQDELINNALLKDTGGEINGDVSIVKPNSGTGVAISTLTLGNNIDWGTVGNTYGALEMYSGHTQKVTLYAGNPTADRELTCPDATGTIVITNNPSDITIDRKNGTASSQGWSSLYLGNNKATGTAENSAGDLQIYGRTQYKTEIISKPSAPTDNRTIYLPDTNGTLMCSTGSWVTLVAPTDLTTQNTLSDTNKTFVMPADGYVMAYLNYNSYPPIEVAIAVRSGSTYQVWGIAKRDNDGVTVGRMYVGAWCASGTTYTILAKSGGSGSNQVGAYMVFRS